MSKIEIMGALPPQGSLWRRLDNILPEEEQKPTEAAKQFAHPPKPWPFRSGVALGIAFAIVGRALPQNSKALSIIAEAAGFLAILIATLPLTFIATSIGWDMSAAERSS